jgi:hypothetical protein
MIGGKHGRVAACAPPETIPPYPKRHDGKLAVKYFLQTLKRRARFTH